MRTSLKLWAIAAAVALFTHYAHGQEPKAEVLSTRSSSWWTDVSVSPYGAVKHADIAGKPIWGAGLDIGYAINRTVSLHLANTIFDRPDRFHDQTLVEEGGWLTGSTLDETELLCRADLIRGGGSGKDRFVVFVLGGGTRDHEAEDWGFGVGAGAELRLSKNFSLGADSRLRAWFSSEKDVMTRAFLSLRF